MEPYADVAEAYAAFARHAAGESPCFEDWATSVAADHEVVAWLSALPPGKSQPNLVFAAARWHGVPAPGPYDALRAALLGDDGALRATILARSTQTNEAGRSAVLVPALASLELPGEEPLALVEAGASAGLCLLPDRWRYRWRTPDGEVLAGPSASPEAPEAPELVATVSGPAPLPKTPPAVAWRAGIDLNPLDVTDPDAVRWLEALVWPEQEDRREVLARAVALARETPPDVRRGDLLTDLAALVEEAAAHGLVVVLHTAVAAYLLPEDRRRFTATMLDLVRAGRCHWVSSEGPRVLPEVTATEPAGVAGATGTSEDFVLGVDGRAVGRCHGHGRRLTWW